jgi:hypothetical protein
MEVVLMERMRFAAPVVCGVSLLCICVLVLGMFPAQPAEATSRPIPINNFLDDFAEGTFLRTSLSQDSEDLEVDNLDASVQLAITGSLGRFNLAQFRLPTRLTQMGATALENRLYILGGREVVGDDVLETVGDVWSAEISLAAREGQLPIGDTLVPCAPDEDCLQEPNYWRRESALPVTVGARELVVGPDEPISRTHSVAVAAVDNPTGDDYIYVLGGAGGSPEESQYSVRIAVVDNEVEVDPETGEDVNVGRGTITEWITSDDVVLQDGDTETYPMRIPGSNLSQSPTFEQRGLQLASAATATINGTTYLYLIGGQVRWESFDGILLTGAPYVFYARVGDDGRLYRPNTTTDTDSAIGWAQQPLPESVWKNTFGDGDGIWNSSVVVGTYAEFGTAMYIIGGQIEDSRKSSEAQDLYSSRVIRLPINDDGSLQVEPGSDWVGIIGDELYAHGSVEFRGSVYVTGGRKGVDEPTTDALASYVEDFGGEALVLHDYIEDSPDESQRHFALPDPDDPQGPPLPEALAFHGMTSLADGFGSVFLYVMGGSYESTRGHSDRVYFLRINNESFNDPVLSSNGWYYSPRNGIDINQDGQDDSVVLEEIIWDTDLDMRSGNNAAIDVRIQYRTSPDTCDRTTWTQDDWMPRNGYIDGDEDQDYYSIDGVNSVTINDLTGLSDQEINDLPRMQCFQYRANLATNETRGTDALPESPRLLSLTIRGYIKDSPDLHASITPVWTNGEVGNIQDLEIVIENRYIEGTPEDEAKTLRADVELLEGNGLNPYYSIDLFLFEPGESVITPTLPMNFDQWNAISDTIPLTVGNPEVATQYGARKSLWPALETREIYPRLELCGNLQADDCLVWVRENDEGQIEAFDPKFLFTETGTYHVCVAVDSFVSEPLENFPRGEVNETLDDAESNNFTCEEIFISQPPVPRLRLHLPIVAK